MNKLSSFEDLKNLRSKIIRAENNKIIVAVCSGTGCRACKSQTIAQKLEDEIKKRNLKDKVLLKRTGCHGFCEKGPIILISPYEFCYLNVNTEDVEEIIENSLLQGKGIERLMYKDEKGNPVYSESKIPFYNKQMKIILENNSKLDSLKIEDYIKLGGYLALDKVLSSMSPEDVLKQVIQADLRGRGGGGFPAGIKWQTACRQKEKTKYIIVNADEGDPGAYMDEALLEGNPYLVLEGLMIAAYAIGAEEGFIYVRQEYPLALTNILNAIEQAEKAGLLNKNILGKGFNFTVTVHRGAGSFVSGESSALITAIEGEVGRPRTKYIRTAVSGLWGKPTILNNVETLANIPFIINKGTDWFRKIGTEKSKGTKIFSLVGKVKNTGLVEVPMGTSLRKIIYEIGGGILEDKKFKAVQTGGPSGGCIPESMLDIEVDFDRLTEVGSMMGSGGMIVMDEDSCMVDVAKYFLNFLSEESCGKCIPCREGINQMLKVFERITSGKGQKEDIKILEDLSELLSDGSLCALGKTAANPVLSTLKYFRQEYEAHIQDKECPAGVCKKLVYYWIDPERCKGCMLCQKVCSVNAIKGTEKQIHFINHDKCIKCGSCLKACPERFKALKKISKNKILKFAHK